MWQNVIGKKNGVKRCLLPALAILSLSGCATKASVENCTSVACRPQPEAKQLVIWWHPDLRSGAADFSLVSVDD